MKNLKKQRKDLMESFTKQAIHKAVMEVIAEEGLQGITMGRVAKNAGIAKGTIYLYFKDKEDLIRSAIESIFEPMIENIMAILTGTLPPDQKLREGVKQIFETSIKHRNAVQIVLYNLSVMKLHEKRYMNKRFNELMAQMTKVIQEGIDSGLFKNMDASTMTMMFVESTNAVISKYLWLENDPKAINKVDLFIDVFMNGMLSKTK